MEDWKDLDIKNIPSDFFVNEDYETECYGTFKKWGHCYSDFKNKIAMIEIINDPEETFKYRYRLKPLESIQITEDVKEFILTAFQVVDSKIECRYDSDNIFSFDNRKVEIIK